MTVFLLADESYLRSVLARPVCGPRYFLSLQELSSGARELLRAHHVQPAPSVVWSASRREELLNAYVSLVGGINNHMNCRLWWATDFSSKNRFQCRLPELLEQFLTIVETIEKIPSAQLYVLPVRWELRSTLLKAFSCRVYGSALEGVGIVFLARARRIGAAFYHFYRALLRRFWSFRILCGLGRRFDKKKKYYVIKTFVYDHSFDKNGQYSDAYFGSLPDFLNKKGEEILFLADILGDFKGCLSKIAVCSNALIVPLDWLASINDLFLEHLHAAFYNPQINKKCFFQGYDVSGIVNCELAAHSGRIQAYQLTQFIQARAFCRCVGIKAFLTPYENNPWEKMCILALRQFSPGARIIAYQHNVTPQASVNMFLAQEEQASIPKADVVLTVGEIAQEMITRYSHAVQPPIRVSAALRLEYLFRLQFCPRPRDGTILLALEGIVDVYRLVNYVLGHIAKNGKRRFIIRTHPVLPVASFVHKLIAPLTDFSSVEISTGKSVAEDIMRSDIVIYWGSTVALEALWMQRPLIHYEMGRMFSFDPVIGHCPLRWTVNDQDDLRECFARIEGLSEKDLALAMVETREYLKRYFHQPNSENLSLFLA